MRFDDVTFHYPSRPDAAALAEFTLDVARGREGGAGRAVGRRQDDGVPAAAALLRSAARHDRASTASTCAPPIRREVRARLALVPQEPVIFAASVADNVRYGRPDATDDEVRAACEAAYATEFIERLPERYASFLGERGVRLSGGQRQRLAIARAILADRPILLLDEATSALDAESERMVQLALERLMAGRTVLIIAHRLATVRHADRIVVHGARPHHRDRNARRADALQSALRAPGGAAVRRARARPASEDGRVDRRRGSTMTGCAFASTARSMSVVTYPGSPYELHQPFLPAGDQPEAIARWSRACRTASSFQTLLGVTGSGKTYTMANVIAQTGRPAIVHRAQQDARRAALLRVPRVLPEQRGRVLRLVLRLLPARGVRPVARPLHREGQLDQRAHRADAPVGDQGDPRAAGLRDRGDGVGDLRHRRPDRVPQHDPAPASRATASSQRDAIKRLTEMQYTRNDVDFKRGVFRVRGDVLDIFPAENAENAIRVSLFDDEVETLQLFDPLTGHLKQKLARFTVFPSSHYVTGRQKVLSRDRPDQGRARRAEGVLRRPDEADRGAAHRAAHALRPRDDDRDRLLQGHRELLALPVRAQRRASRRRR